jgi:hypothetical protein
MPIIYKLNVAGNKKATPGRVAVPVKSKNLWNLMMAVAKFLHALYIHFDGSNAVNRTGNE